MKETDKEKDKYFCGKCKYIENITKINHKCLFYNEEIYELRYRIGLLRLNVCLRENRKSE